MGIKNLNRYFRNTVKRGAIKRIHIEDLKNDIIAIDTSIFLYKFTILKGGSLLDHFKTMVDMFRQNKVTPFFVFDGKPPPEKSDELKERGKVKEKAEKEYKELEKQLEVMAEGAGKKETNEIKKQMEELKANFIHIKKSDIVNLKKMFDEMNVQYYESPGEADMVLAYLVESKKAFAVLSDDMDFFLYGVSHVLRQFNLEKKTFTLYDTDRILKDLNVTHKEFVEVSVLSGTDYNKNEEIDLKEVWNLMYKFKDLKDKKSSESFYDWLKDNDYIKDINISKLNKIIESFDIKTNPYFLKNKDEIESIRVSNEFSSDRKWVKGTKVEENAWKRGFKP